MMRAALAAAAAIAAGWMTSAVSQQPPPIQIAACDASAGPSLYCADLVPTPDLRAATGRLDFTSPPGPFAVSPTIDGHAQYRLTAVVEGLPSPASLGEYRVYVAWAATLSLDREVRLGEVRNGRNELGEIAIDQFRVFVSAERSASVDRRSGRLVLRAVAPTARLLVHRDVMQPTAAAPGSAAAPVHEMHSHDAAMAAPGETWTMPPMNGLPMMPGMHGLVPSVAPFRPGTTVDPSSVAAARPREIVRLASGATLDLDASLVRRTIEGRTFTMYAFNGQYPGPLVQVDQGSTITVRFTNHLDLPSTVHWHGVRLENASDGTPGVTQDPVAPGGTFVYTVHFRDAGIYWYHPHHREDIEQDLGLYGNILVAPSARGYYSPVNREEALTLDDFLVGDDGTAVAYGREQPTHALMGRFGNVFLTNGEPDYRLTVSRGDVVRLFLTNVSNARIYNVSLGGLPLKVVGSDLGKFEHEAWVTSIVLAPAERMIVEVRFPEAGEVPLVNKVQALNHMFGNFFSEQHRLATVRVLDSSAGPSYAAEFATLRRNADVVADIDRYRADFTRPPDHELTITMRARGLPPAVSTMLLGASVPVDWNDGMPMENWLTTAKEISWILREPSTGRENMDIVWRFREGDVVKIRLVNDPESGHPMSHPIHVHGQRFLVLRRNGVDSENLVWKDTTIVPAGQTVDLLVEMSNPGRWMLHCHIAEHVGAGMMTVFRVEPAGQAHAG